MGLRCEALQEDGVAGDVVVVVPVLLRHSQAESDERVARAEAMEALVQVVDRLLGPGGCPWDREQTHETLKKYLVEETYEVLEAIDSGSKEKLKEELGDLLLQPLMHAQMERAAGSWDIAEVAQTITAKLIRRHPHVFGQVSAEDADEVLRNWDRIKQEERGEPADKVSPPSILDGVPKALPALHRAFEVSKRAARVGFEWPNVEAVFEKLEEEDAELREAIRQAAGSPSDAARRRVEEEVGDMLFTVVNLARWCDVEPEEALRRMVGRFTERFQKMEAIAERPLLELTANEWDRLWEAAKTDTLT